MTVEELQDAAAQLAQSVPGAQLQRNEVGNLAVMLDDAYVGYLDLGDGSVELYV